MENEKINAELQKKMEELKKEQLIVNERVVQLYQSSAKMAKYMMAEVLK